MTAVRTADAHTAFRAAWALEKAYAVDRWAVVERFGQFLEDWIATDNHSVKRIYTKMLYDMLLWERVEVDNVEAERIAERGFDILIEQDCPVGTRTWLIELLTLIGKRVDWIEETLTPLVRRFSEEPEAKPATRFITRKYLKNL